MLPEAGLIYVKACRCLTASICSMTQACVRLAALVASLFLIGACNDVDYSRDRAISTDISATRETGSTTLEHGNTPESVPTRAMPWQLK